MTVRKKEAAVVDHRSIQIAGAVTNDHLAFPTYGNTVASHVDPFDSMVSVQTKVQKGPEVLFGSGFGV